MVRQRVEDAVATGVAGPANRTALVVLRIGAVLVLIDPGNVDGGDPVHGALDPIAVRVVEERRAHAAATHGREAVLVVVSLS